MPTTNASAFPGSLSPSLRTLNLAAARELSDRVSCQRLQEALCPPALCSNVQSCPGQSVRHLTRPPDWLMVQQEALTAEPVAAAATLPPPTSGSYPTNFGAIGASSGAAMQGVGGANFLTSESHSSYRDANGAYPAQAGTMNGYSSQNAGYGEQRAAEQRHAPPRHDEQLLWAMQGAMQAYGNHSNQNALGPDRSYGGAQPLGGGGGGMGGGWAHERAPPPQNGASWHFPGSSGRGGHTDMRSREHGWRDGDQAGGLGRNSEVGGWRGQPPGRDKFGDRR